MEGNYAQWQTTGRQKDMLVYLIHLNNNNNSINNNKEIKLKTLIVLGAREIAQPWLPCTQLIQDLR